MTLATQVRLTLFSPPLARVDSSLLSVEDDCPLRNCFNTGSIALSVCGLSLVSDPNFEFIVTLSTVAGGRMASMEEP
jgi:hypothetical protein